MNSATPSLSPAGPTVSYIFSAGHRGHDRDSPLPGVASEPGCFLSGKGGRHVPLSRRDIMRIARRFNAGKHPARRTSPEGTAEGWRVGLDFSRPFGTRDLLASNPALKRWAILDCPFGTAKQRQRSSHADKTAPMSSSTTCG